MGGTTELLTIFKDTDHLLVLYHLAKYNPRITEMQIAQQLSLNENLTRQILTNLAANGLVFFENEHGYTLTEKGLAALYNYHTTISE